MSVHEAINPEGLAPAIGFSHGIAAEAGRSVHVAGEIATDPEGRIVGTTWAEQFDRTLANVVTVLGEAAVRPDHVVSMQIFTTDVSAYRKARPILGPIYQKYMGKHFPAIALAGVTELVEPTALVEITATAVVPSPAGIEPAAATQT